MAIHKVDPNQLNLTPNEEEELFLKINNGDLKALNILKTKWKFKTNEDIFRFALAILTKADKPSITVSEGGKPQTYSPARTLLEDDESRE